MDVHEENVDGGDEDVEDVLVNEVVVDDVDAEELLLVDEVAGREDDVAVGDVNGRCTGG